MMWSAVRGFIATGVPLLVLSAIGLQGPAVFTLLGGLNTCIADTGGEYRSRLLGMSLVLFVVPVLLFCGMQVHGAGWQALMLCLVAIIGGFARALGATGTAVGLVGAIVFLIGIQLQAPPLEALSRAGFYAAGAAWAIFVSVVIWRLRPYRRIRNEIGGCLEITARFLNISSRRRAGGSRDQDRDRIVAEEYRKVRESIERARTFIGELQTAGANDKIIADLIVILRAASRIAALGIAIREVRLTAPSDQIPEDVLTWMDRSLATIAGNCHTLAQEVMGGHGDTPSTILPALSTNQPESAFLDQLAAMPGRMAVHVGDAIEALDRLTDSRPRGPRLMPTLSPRAMLRSAGATLGAHLSARSLILRHALRVGIATGSGLILAEQIHVPHPIWIPLTTLVVLQPNFGGTLSRGIARTIGTVAGAALASSLLLILPAPVGTTIAMAALTFATFLFMARRYAIGVSFLTALIILMLSSLSEGAWSNVIGRVLDTLLGTGIALVVGFVLWPIWDRHQAPEQIARALWRLKDFAKAQLTLLASGAWPEGQTVAEIKRQVEIEITNSDAMFQRERMEPQASRAERYRHMAMLIQMQRLHRHLTALGAALEHDRGPHPVFAVSAGKIPAVLDELANDMSRERVEDSAVMQSGRTGGETPLDRLVDRISSDVDAMRALVSERQTGKPI